MFLLEQNGYSPQRKYYSDGNISDTFGKDNSYHLDDTFELFNDDIIIKKLKCINLVIAVSLSSERAMNILYDYCAKNNIRVIINCGDILDGTCSRTEQILNPEEQIDNLIKHYPFDKNIFTLYTIGDHDASVYYKKNISLVRILNNKRHDICSIAPNDNLDQFGFIKFNDNKIMVSHKACPSERNLINDVKLHLTGHMHSSKMGN